MTKYILVSRISRHRENGINGGSYEVPLGGGDHIPGLNVETIEQSYECINH